MKYLRELKRRRQTDENEKRGYDWRTLQFSDFDCQLGKNTYALHRVIIGSGSRCAKFFSAVSANNQFVESREKKMDLSQLLPENCWPHFESFLDFVYQKDVEFTEFNIVPLLKLANTLDCFELSTQAAIALGKMSGLNESSAEEIYKSAIELGVERAIELTTPHVSAAFMEACLPQPDLDYTAVTVASSCIQLLKTCRTQDQKPWDPKLKGRVLELNGPVAYHTGLLNPGQPNDQIKPSSFFRWGSAYSKTLATSGIHYWRVRVNGSIRASADDNGFGFAMGVARHSLFRQIREPNDDFIGYLGYCYIARTGQVFGHGDDNGNGVNQTKYGPKYESFDIIGVELDLDKRTVEFYKNDEPLGIAYRNVPKDEEGYRFGCSMHNSAWGVEFLSHEVIQPSRPEENEEELPSENSEKASEDLEKSKSTGSKAGKRRRKNS